MGLLLSAARRFGGGDRLSFVGIKPIENLFLSRYGDVRMIAAGNFDIFDLDAEFLRGFDHDAGSFDRHGWVFVAVNHDLGNVFDFAE